MEKGKYFGEFLTVIFITSIPAILTVLSTSDSFLSFLIERGYISEKNKSTTGTTLAVFSVILPTFILLILNLNAKHKEQRIKKQRDYLLSELKESYLKYFEQEFEFTDGTLSDLNMRIWVQEKNFIKKFLDGFTWNSLVFKVYPMHNLSKNDIKNKLYFEVYPRKQGLVGICYNEGRVVHREDVSNLYDEHKLNDFQKARTKGTKFVLCVPIFHPTKEKIVSIVSFDCTNKINIPKDKESYVHQAFEYFCYELYENIPELFSGKG